MNPPLSGPSYRGMGYPKRTTDMGWPEEDALWVYTPLPAQLALEELSQLSGASSLGDTDAVSFQPCTKPMERSQDRYVVQDWEFDNGRWSFRAVFDGHAGHHCADYAASALPRFIQERLLEMLQHTPNYISAMPALLARAIFDFDAEIGRKLVDIFPDHVALGQMFSGDIEDIINDDGPNSDIVLRAMRGSTALISLIDPGKKNLWVASLGDCAAVLGTRNYEKGSWDSMVLSVSHNGDNLGEVNRIRMEHPGEREAVLNGRVLGAIAVTRALGDYAFKLPKEYTSKVFLNCEPPYATKEKVADFMVRNHTPPYMNALPDVRHVDLSTVDLDHTFLIMCSDGLTDLSPDRLHLKERLAAHWVDVVSRGYLYNTNLAFSLLRDAVGGDDIDKISRHITVEMSARWMDDTTILVQRLGRYEL